MSAMRRPTVTRRPEDHVVDVDAAVLDEKLELGLRRQERAGAPRSARLRAREMAAVQECLRQSEGMILTTGPTGSGKSTTLYAMLQAIHSPEVNIVTVENPIDYRGGRLYATGATVR